MQRAIADCAKAGRDGGENVNTLLGAFLNSQIRGGSGSELRIVEESPIAIMTPTRV